MSKYGIKYEIEFANCEYQIDIDGNRVADPQTINIGIYDRTSVIADDAPISIISLEPAGDPLHITSVDTSDDKFTPIRAIQATIKFHSSSAFNLSSFTDTIYFTTPVGDPRYYVEILCNSLPIFKGFLILDDCSEDFMPHPNVVTLAANDGLGLLKDIPLSLLVTNNPPYYRLADFIAGALNQTGLSLQLNSVFNLRELNNPSSHLFDVIYLWNKSFVDSEANGILYENCYSVIEKILGEAAFLTQRCGEWWILRPGELDNTLHYRTTFNSLGVLSTVYPGSSNFLMTINKDFGEMFFSQEQTEVVPQGEFKYIKETYSFQTPEIPCNKDFSRGNYISNLPDEVVDGETLTVKKYEIDCWTLKREFPEHTPITLNSSAYIKRGFNANDYEKFRYVVVETSTDNNTVTPYIESEGVPVDIKDKFSISVDYRFPTQISSGGGFYDIMNIVLHGDDGSWWLHGREEPGNTAEDKWYDTSGFTAFTSKGQQGFNFATSGTDETQWASQSYEVKPMPVAGTLYIWLNSINTDSGSYDNVDVYYSNLSVEYIPYINGSYHKYTKIYDKVSQPVGYRRKRERDVYVSDGIKKLFRGALHRISGLSYVLTDDFFDWHALQTTTPASSDVHPYLHLQAFDVWNQHRNVMRIFHATVQGLQSHRVDNYGNVNHPSLIHRYEFQDPSRHTTNKYFMLMSFDQDWYTCEWKGTFAEVYDLTKGKRYDDVEEVKYE